MMRFLHVIVRAACAAVCLAVAGGPAAVAQTGPAEQRLALVIGNAAYPRQTLNNPANDARAMAASLRKLGFAVIERIDVGKKAMEDAILEFGEKLKAGGVGLFYYAGHGVQVRGHNYLVPLDATLPSEASVRVQAVDVDLVLEQMAEARNRANVVILDACRNNPFLPQRRGAGKGLAAIDAARGTLIAYSTAPGTLAVDGEGANSPYTASLVRAIEQPGLTIEEVFKRVRQTVIEATQGAQTPWESSSLTGDLVLNLNITVNLPPAAATPAPAPAPASASTQAAQVAFWESMGRSTNPGDYEEYLRQFPDGIYAGLAKRRIADLKRQQAAAAPPAAAAPAAPVQPPKAVTAPAPSQARPVQPTAPPPPAAPTATQQAAIAPPPPDTTGVSRFDGRWTGQDKQWRAVLDIRNGEVAGTITCPGWPGTSTVKTTVDAGGRIAFDLKGLRLETRQVFGTLPNLSITPGGDCGGASMVLRQEGAAATQTAATPPATAAPAPYGQPAAAPAAAAAQLRQRSYERVMSILLGQTVGSGIDQGKRNDYRGAPRPKAIAACIDWSGGTPESLRVGSWASSWIPPGAIGVPPRQDALEKCTRGNNTPERCVCQVVDENDANALDLPQDFATGALRR
jgi:hypothetical protein